MAGGDRTATDFRVTGPFQSRGHFIFRRNDDSKKIRFLCHRSRTGDVTGQHVFSLQPERNLPVPECLNTFESILSRLESEDRRGPAKRFWKWLSQPAWDWLLFVAARARVKNVVCAWRLAD